MVIYVMMLTLLNWNVLLWKEKSHLKKPIYGLKQASRQWYLKFDHIIRQFGFEENKKDNCIYAGCKFIFLIWHVDDIFFAGSDKNMLLETKRFLTSKFDTTYLSEVAYVLAVEIQRDRSKRILRLSMKAYIEKLLKKYNMRNCLALSAPVVKGDKFRKSKVQIMSMK